MNAKEQVAVHTGCSMPLEFGLLFSRRRLFAQQAGTGIAAFAGRADAEGYPVEELLCSLG